MLYQKIQSGERPYYISIGRVSSFQEHRHADFEMNFCLEGTFDILADKKLLHVEAGCTTLLPPMCAHEIPENTGERSVLTVTVGMSLLKEHFSDFSRHVSAPKVCDLRGEENKRIRELFMECAEALREGRALSDLLIMGNIYKIFAYLFDHREGEAERSCDGADYLRIENVEKALELI